MCNKDCFNCPYPDCIRDYEQDDRARRKRYYYSRREQESARRKEYYKNHKEQEKANSKRRYERIKADAVKYAAYRESRNAYLREYRRRKNAKKAG